MTPERLEEIVASLVGQTDRDKACELAAEVRRLHEAVRLAAELIRDGHDETCDARYGTYRCRCDADEREAWLRAYGSR